MENGDSTRKNVGFNDILGDSTRKNIWKHEVE
jgi:hypothetical protein